MTTTNETPDVNNDSNDKFDGVVFKEYPHVQQPVREFINNWTSMIDEVKPLATENKSVETTTTPDNAGYPLEVTVLPTDEKMLTTGVPCASLSDAYNVVCNTGITNESLLSHLLFQKKETDITPEETGYPMNITFAPKETPDQEQDVKDLHVEILKARVQESVPLFENALTPANFINFERDGCYMLVNESGELMPINPNVDKLIDVITDVEQNVVHAELAKNDTTLTPEYQLEVMGSLVNNVQRSINVMTSDKDRLDKIRDELLESKNKTSQTVVLIKLDENDSDPVETVKGVIAEILKSKNSSISGSPTAVTTVGDGDNSIADAEQTVIHVELAENNPDPVKTFNEIRTELLKSRKQSLDHIVAVSQSDHRLISEHFAEWTQVGKQSAPPIISFATPDITPTNPLISEYMADILKADPNTVDALRNGIVQIAKDAYGVLVEHDLSDRMKDGIINTDEVITDKSDIQPGYSWSTNITINKDTGNVTATPVVTVEPEPLPAITTDLNNDDMVFTDTPQPLMHLEALVEEATDTIGRGQLHPEVYYIPSAEEDTNTTDVQDIIPVYQSHILINEALPYPELEVISDNADPEFVDILSDCKKQLVTVVNSPVLNGEFPVDNLDHALHSDHVADNYVQRSNALLSWLNGSNCVRAVIEILRAYNSTWPEKWLEYVHPDALVAETDEGIRLFLVKRALHLVFIAYENEDITNVLMAVNNNNTTPTWLVTFERQVVPVMIRLGL